MARGAARATFNLNEICYLDVNVLNLPQHEDEG